jgi:hypothetical protein
VNALRDGALREGAAPTKPQPFPCGSYVTSPTHQPAFIDNPHQAQRRPHQSTALSLRVLCVLNPRTHQATKHNRTWRVFSRENPRSASNCRPPPAGRSARLPRAPRSDIISPPAPGVPSCSRQFPVPRPLSPIAAPSQCARIAPSQKRQSTQPRSKSPDHRTPQRHQYTLGQHAITYCLAQMK